jgi:hypothetical protein
MKNSHQVRLRLEVLEDRLALTGFGGAIMAAPPSLTPFPFNGLMGQTIHFDQTRTGFRNSFANFPQLTFVAAPSLQSQLQSLQSAQTAMIDQFFSEVGTMLQQLHLTVIV